MSKKYRKERKAPVNAYIWESISFGLIILFALIDLYENSRINPMTNPTTKFKMIFKNIKRLYHKFVTHLAYKKITIIKYG
jgi:hypothetical protein